MAPPPSQRCGLFQGMEETGSLLEDEEALSELDAHPLTATSSKRQAKNFMADQLMTSSPAEMAACIVSGRMSATDVFSSVETTFTLPMNFCPR